MKAMHPTAILVAGLPGSGKSYFARHLAPTLEAAYFNSDILRKTLVADRHYTFSEKANIYAEMLSRFDHALRAGQTVVVDATFYKKELRDQFSDVAHAIGAKVVWVLCTASEARIRERLSHPRKDSEADFAVYKQIKDEFEPIEEPHLVLRTDHDDTETLIEKTVAWIETQV
jgi:predicted kinase